MPKTPTQPNVILQRAGEGAFANVRGFMVPEPPGGCESQQLFDWGAVVSITLAGHIDLPCKLRLVEVYCERWGIETEDKDIAG